MKEEKLGVRQVASELGVTTDYIRELLRTGKLKGTKVANFLWVIDRKDVEKFKEQREKSKKK